MKRFLLILSLVLLVVACENDTYDSGDGALSYMRADFVEASTDASARIASVIADDGEQFSLSPAFACKWAETPDSVYRALLYYNKVETSSGDIRVQPVAISSVMTPVIRSVSDIKEAPVTDPVNFVSAWRSRNGKYINMELSVKTGTSDVEDMKHIIGMVCDDAGANGTGGKRTDLIFTHNRMNIPEYYSVTIFVSIPVQAVPGNLSEGDEIAVKVNTYDGMVTKIFHL